MYLMALKCYKQNLLKYGIFSKKKTIDADDMKTKVMNTGIPIIGLIIVGLTLINNSVSIIIG